MIMRDSSPRGARSPGRFDTSFGGAKPLPPSLMNGDRATSLWAPAALGPPRLMCNGFLRRVGLLNIGIGACARRQVCLTNQVAADWRRCRPFCCTARASVSLQWCITERKSEGMCRGVPFRKTTARRTSCLFLMRVLISGP